MVNALKLKGKWSVLQRIFGALGISVALKYIWQHSLGFGTSAEYQLHPRRIKFPLIVRRSASDIEVFKQIYIFREYACLEDLPDVRLVIDCGANVGYSSAYFLSVFPQAVVIAIEPDPGNFSMLQRNLSRYGARATCIQAGVWSQPAQLVLSPVPYSDGREWSRQVRVCAPGESSEFEGVDIGTLLARSGHQHISLLKVDVEGAEAVIFAENFQSWLDHVDAIAIELHDDSMFGNGSDVFQAAIRDQNFKISRSGELTICRRR